MKPLPFAFFACLTAGSCLATCASAQSPVPRPKDATGTARQHMKLPEPADPKLPSLFLIGDSTVRNGADDGQGKGAEGQWGWGHTITRFFDPTKINVVNRAVGGLSSRTYLTGGYWERTLPLIKSGDFVMMQFGTNDSGKVNDNFRARGSIPGVGEEQQEIDNLLTGKHEVVYSFGWYLRKFIADAEAKGATPIVCSLVPRKSWDEHGLIKRARADYAGWAGQVAEQQKVGFIDLNEISARRYDALGHDLEMKLFPQVTPDEHTHTNLAGADLLAECVVSGLKSLQPDPLESFLSEAGQNVAPADLSQPAPTPPTAGPTVYRFQFGGAAAASGYTLVPPTRVYARDPGYGFEPVPSATVVSGPTDNPVRNAAVTSAKPFSFSVAVPEGNYRVAVTLGDPTAAAVTTVKAESRRLMLESIATAAGQLETRTFTVNVRTPKISGGGEVKLDSREMDLTTHEAISRSWDDKLTLTFSGAHPALAAIEIARVDDAKTVFILGDSTVTDQSTGPGSSWGQMVTRWFKPEIAVANHAESGETLKGFLKERRWEKVLESVKPGDYILIEFGTNDSKDRGPQNMYPNQDFSETYAPAGTTYRELLKRFVADAQKKGALPIILSPSARRGEVAKPSSLGAYAEAAVATARELEIPSIDLNSMGIELNAALGAEAEKQFGDRTHHVEYGSYLQAKCVVLGLQQSKVPLAKFIVDDFGDFDPQHPEPTPARFTLPPDPTGGRRRPPPPAPSPATSLSGRPD